MQHTFLYKSSILICPTESFSMENEENMYFFNDRSRKRIEGKFCIWNEGKETNNECIPNTKPF